MHVCEALLEPAWLGVSAPIHVNWRRDAELIEPVCVDTGVQCEPGLAVLEFVSVPMENPGSC